MQAKHQLVPRPQLQQTFSLKQQQELAVLEMNASQLQSYIEEELEHNPLLEQDLAHESGYITKCEQNFELLMNYIIQEPTLSEVLAEQIHHYRGPILEDLALFLADMLDDNGYLLYDDAQLLRYFPAYDQADLHATIRILQQMEPPGVCARSLQECLLLQLQQRSDPTALLAREILSGHMQELAGNKVRQIAQELHRPMEQVNAALSLIRSLQPRPGSAYSSTAAYLHPDIYVIVEQQEVRIELMHQTYGLYMDRDVYQGRDELKEWLAPYRRRAEGLLADIGKRNETLLKLARAIVRHQQDHFLHGGALRPYTMKQAAEEIGVHESTVSRCVSGKTLVFQQQIIPFRYFFPKTLEQEDTGTVQAALHALLRGEDRRHPYSDEQLTQLLTKQGYHISRRTVTKYREQLSFPSASKRRRYE